MDKEVDTREDLEILAKFYLRPFFGLSLLSLLIWLYINSKTPGYGLGAPILYEPNQLLSDWKITAIAAAEKNPWKYLGSWFEGKLPPTFYGPITYLILKLIGANHDFYPHTRSFLVFTALAGSYVYTNFRISCDLKRPDLEILFWTGISSYPVIFMFNRGSASIISAVFSALLCHQILNSKDLKIPALLISCLALCHWQNILLLPVFAMKGLRNLVWIPAFLITASLTLMFSVGATPKVLISTLNINQFAMQDTLHNTSDIATQAKMLFRIFRYDELNTFTVLTFLALSVFAVLILKIFWQIWREVTFERLKLLMISITRGHGNAHNLIEELDTSCTVRTRILLFAAIYFLLSLSIAISSPSYDYHLSKILPFFIGSAYIILINYEKIKGASKPLVSGFFFFNALVYSYFQLWGPYHTSFSSLARSLSLPISTLFGCVILLTCSAPGFRKDVIPFTRKSGGLKT